MSEGSKTLWRSGSKGQNRDTLGLIVETTYAVKTNGIPLGILDQKIFSRDSSKDELTKLHDTMIRKQIPIELIVLKVRFGKRK